MSDRIQLGTCDREQAEKAYVRVELPSGKPLELCFHHYQQHAEALTAQGAEVLQAEPVPA